MSNIPPGLKYTASHEWIRAEGDGAITVGITDHAQAALGDLVFIDSGSTPLYVLPGLAERRVIVVTNSFAAVSITMKWTTSIISAAIRKPGTTPPRNSAPTDAPDTSP